MSVLSAQSINHRVTLPIGSTLRLRITPYEPKKVVHPSGLSYGLTAAGYDIRAGKLGVKLSKETPIHLRPSDFRLIASYERLRIPPDVQAIVHDKSTWARRGLAVQNTVLEPGWEGWITLELSNHGVDTLRIEYGTPIAQVVFHKLDEPTHMPYDGKYQDQDDEPVRAIRESSSD